MKKIFLLCALMLTACGADESNEPTEPTTWEATGEYAITATLDEDTCATPSQASEQELNFGTWALTASTEKYYFSDLDSLYLTSYDGNIFTYSDSGPTPWCETETNIIIITLSFTPGGLTGPVTLTYEGLACYDFGTGGTADEGCTRTWFLTGTKL